MRDQLERRLKTLRTELEAGEKMLADMDAKRANLRETLLRISGAIQVLEELLAAERSLEIENLVKTNSDHDSATP
jgi:hypothetical protein